MCQKIKWYSKRSHRKTIMIMWSWSYRTGGEGGQRVGDHNPLGFFQCSRKPQNKIFIHCDSICYIDFIQFDSQDLPSLPFLFKLISLSFYSFLLQRYLKIRQKFTTSLIKKTHWEKQTIWNLLGIGYHVFIVYYYQKTLKLAWDNILHIIWLLHPHK